MMMNHRTWCSDYHSGSSYYDCCYIYRPGDRAYFWSGAYYLGLCGDLCCC